MPGGIPKDDAARVPVREERVIKPESKRSTKKAGKKPVAKKRNS